MSESFLNNHRIIKGKRSELPGGDSTAFDAGHIFQDRIDGTRFVNEGTKRSGAIFGHFPANRYELIERFERKAGLNADILSITEAVRMIANPNFEVLGTNMTSALSTLSTGGGNTLTTAGADGDAAILTPHLDANQSAWAVADWSTDDRVVFETTVVTGANITNAIIWAGLKLTNTNVIATDAEQAFLRYEDDVASGAFQFTTSDNGTDTTTTTTVTVAVSTSYHIKITIDADFNVHCYINGVLHARHLAALGTGHDLIPYVAVEADGAAAAKAITCRGIRMSKDQND
jgi:hypothetical protein